MKLHLGCGKRYIPGFIHIDLCDMTHIDYRHSVDSLPMFQDGTAELIYASHVFEYFDRQQAASVLAEWHRVLMPEGVLRLAVPDFQVLIDVYNRTGELSSILGPLYGRMVVQGGNNKEQIHYHRTVYDFYSLKKLLEENGFTDVHRYDWRQTIHKDYDDFSQAYFPHMDKEHGLLISLNVEAKKK
jgi:predicted SAM-dependent methyltransferase